MIPAPTYKSAEGEYLINLFSTRSTGVKTAVRTDRNTDKDLNFPDTGMSQVGAYSYKTDSDNRPMKPRRLTRPPAYEIFSLHDPVIG